MADVSHRETHCVTLVGIVNEKNPRNLFQIVIIDCNCYFLSFIIKLSKMFEVLVAGDVIDIPWI